MRTGLILSAVCCLAICGAAYAQPDSLWSRTFGGERIDICSSIIQTADGGFALAGSTNSFGVGGYDFWLVHTDENGDSLWSRTYGGEGDDGCSSIIQTADGGFALAGNTSFGAEDCVFRLVRTDANGDSLWSKTYGSEGYETCNDVLQTADGGFALAGICSEGSNFWLVRTNAEGDSLWSRTYGGGWGGCSSIIQTPDNGFALAGNWISGNPDYLLVLTDSDGDLLWSRAFGGDYPEDGCSSLIQTNDGGFVLAGGARMPGGLEEYHPEGIVFGADSEGAMLWSFPVDYPHIGGFSSVIQTLDGGLAVAGTLGETGYWLVRLNERGDSLWSKTYGGEGCNSVIQTADGGFLLAGSTSSYGAGGADFWLVKTGPDPVSVSGDFILHPSAFILSPPFPNPFNGATVVGWQLAVGGAMSLNLYDLSGRIVATLANGYQTAGRHSIIWNAPDAAAGEYVIVLTGGEGAVAAEKVVLLK